VEAGLGFSTHSGWAVAITAGLDDGGHLCVVDRHRVELIDNDLPRQAYHAAAALTAAAADALVARVDASIAARARTVLTEILASTRGVAVVGVAVVGEPRVIPDVATVLSSHARMHACEGEQYRRGLIAAANGFGLSTLRIGSTELTGRLATILYWTSARTQSELAAVRAEIGPPWQKDHKEAALAALAALRPYADRAAWAGA
jgi:hypothetical protein